jgi:hypothetical protein
MYSDDELDYFASFVNPLLPLGYPTEEDEAEFYLSLEAPEPESLIEEEE